MSGELLYIGAKHVNLSHQLNGLICAGIEFFGKEVSLFADLPLKTLVFAQKVLTLNYFDFKFALHFIKLSDKVLSLL